MDKEKETKRYQERVKPRLEEIRAWARDGATEEEIAKKLGVAYSTFREYKAHNSALSAALKCARAYDDEVVNALHKNTLGEKVLLRVPIKCRRIIYDNGKKVSEEEYVVDAFKEEYVRPDTLAQMYWLNNRQPAKWKAKPVEQPDANEQAEEAKRKDELYEVLINRPIEGFEDGENDL